MYKTLVGAAGAIPLGVQMTFPCWYRDPAGISMTGFSCDTSDATELLFTL